MNDEIYYHNDHVSSSIILRCFRKHLKGHVLEVGAGIGGVTKELAKIADQVTSLEPNPDLFHSLRTEVSKMPNVKILQADTAMLSDTVQRDHSGKFDVVLYLNVLEHIQDDVDELRRARRLLVPNGVLIIVVPAHKWLYSRIDRLTGHYRRYSKRMISYCVGTQFDSFRVTSFDTVGIIPYLLVYRLLGSTKVSGVQAKFYSHVILRLSYLTYRVSSGRMVGKNYLVVAQ